VSWSSAVCIRSFEIISIEILIVDIYPPPGSIVGEGSREMSSETRRFVQTAAAAMALVDADGSLVAWSPPFARLCRKAPRTGDPVAPALAVPALTISQSGCHECADSGHTTRVLTVPVTGSSEDSHRLLIVDPVVSDSESSPLTCRNLDVLRLVIMGLTNKEIAQHLSVSISAVKKHLKRLFEHFGVRRRFELFAVVETVDVHNHRDMQ
jgi:DNA-binding CsgD family transcriptional regulator